MAAAGDDTEVIVSAGGEEVRTTLGTIKKASRPNGLAGDHLRAFVERIERLEEEKRTVADDIKGVYGESKAMGFSPKIIRKVIALRRKDESERREEEAMLDTYLHALGMISEDDG
ncbi:DUF2312 domain-containing protein [Rhizobium sp. RHZ01]|nr:DUF2312 domain-containing protein [Rhizobium sp. RHZ01]